MPRPGLALKKPGVTSTEDRVADERHVVAVVSLGRQFRDYAAVPALAPLDNPFINVREDGREVVAMPTPFGAVPECHV
jgi:hypothetical protein